MANANEHPTTFQFRKYKIDFLGIRAENKIIVKLNPRNIGRNKLIEPIMKYVTGTGNSQILLENYRYKHFGHIMGIAKCHPNDEFSVKIGTRLATLRWLRAAAKIMNHRTADFVWMINREIDRELDHIKYRDCTDASGIHSVIAGTDNAEIRE